jgi:hypothetical protein
MIRIRAIIILAAVFSLSTVYAQSETDSLKSDTTAVDSLAETGIKPVDLPAPVTLLAVRDSEGDAGGSISLSWVMSADDGSGLGNVIGYNVLRSESTTGDFDTVGTVSAGMSEYSDATTDDHITYFYKIETLSDVGSSMSDVSEGVRSSAQWFNTRDLDTFIIGVIICFSVIFFIFWAQKGRKLYLRKIAGLEAVDEAIGRATEMGRPILFIPGILDMDDVQTVAGITILGRVARTIAEYDTQINMPVSRSIVMTTARETIKQAYVAAGRPDAYSDEMVHYLTDEQFGYVAAVDGIMVREKPATCFYIGAFFAESLIFAETGHSIGAIQIAGTAMPAQLPFFVAACDYTLIGEELFAASAYLSGEPKQLGSLKGQDVGKMIAMGVIILLCVLFTVAAISQSEGLLSLAEKIRGLFSAS